MKNRKDKTDLNAFFYSPAWSMFKSYLHFYESQPKYACSIMLVKRECIAKIVRKLVKRPFMEKYKTYSQCKRQRNFFETSLSLYYVHASLWILFQILWCLSMGHRTSGKQTFVWYLTNMVIHMSRKILLTLVTFFPTFFVKFSVLRNNVFICKSNKMCVMVSCNGQLSSYLTIIMLTALVLYPVIYNF